VKERLRRVVRIVQNTLGKSPHYIINLRGRVFLKVKVPCTSANKAKILYALERAGFVDVAVHTSSYLEGFKRATAISQEIEEKLRILPEKEIVSVERILTWADKIKITDEVLLFYRKAYGLTKGDSMRLWYIRQAVKGFPICEECLEPMRLVDIIESEDGEVEVYKCKVGHMYEVSSSGQPSKCGKCGGTLPLVAFDSVGPTFGLCRNKKCEAA
jgi:hypothetical protein